MHKFNSTALAALALVAASNATADPIVDTGAGAALSGGGRSLNQYQGLAGVFDVLAPTRITAIHGWIGSSSQTGTILASIHRDGDYLPGTTLFSSSFALGADGWQGLTGLAWNVDPGRYWVSFTTTDADAWMTDGAPQPLTGYSYTSGGAWKYSKSLDVGVRIDGIGAGGVPEPAAWAMLIGGFALAGGSLRRRARVTVRYAAA